MKLKYFYKYYYTILKIKSLSVNKYKINKDPKKVIFIKKNNNKRRLKNIIIRDKNTSSTGQISYKSSHMFPLNNICDKFNFGNNSDYQIKYGNKETKPQKRRNNSTNLLYTDSEFLAGIMYDTYKNNNYLNFRTNNKKFNRKIINNDSFSNFKNNNKTFTYKNFKNIENKSDNGSNIIIDYINGMEKYNKMIMAQKSMDTKNISIKKNNTNFYTQKKNSSCFNTPIVNKISNKSINTNKNNPFFSITNNKKGNCNTEENKIIHQNYYYILNQANNNYESENIVKAYSPNSKEIKSGILRKNISKTNSTKNKLNTNNYLDDYKLKIIEINNLNKNLFNRINSNSFKKNKQSSYKKENDYFYDNNTSKYFKSNSFLNKNLSSSKHRLDYKNSNDKINMNKTNYFSPVLLNRLDNNKFKKIPKSNTTNNKIKIDKLINYNKNIIQYNLLDNYNNSFSTNYKDKQSIKDIDESGTKIYFNNKTCRDCKISKSNTSYYHNKKTKNIIFITNNKNSKAKNNTKYTYTKDNKANSLIKNINKDILKQNPDKKIIKTCSYYNIPISTTKKSNSHILQNISLSNNSADKTFNDNNTQSLNHVNNKVNSAITNTKYLNNNKYKNNNNIRISSLFSILKEDKNSIIKNEDKPKNYSYLNITNEKFENKNNNIKENINNNINNKEKCLDTSFESLTDSKMLELAKTYVQKDECLDMHEMEQILKNKKDVLNKCN